MLEILTVTSPIFLIICLGFVAVRTNLFHNTLLPAIGSFVINFCLPALIVKSLSQSSVNEVLNVRYLAAYAIGSLTTLAIAMAWAHWFRKQKLGESAIYGMGMSCANSGFIGFPIALQILGPIAILALALTMLVENILMIPLCITLAESGGRGHERFGVAFRKALGNMSKTPIFISILLGLAIALFTIKLPAPLIKSIDLLASAGAPAALFFIGGSLVGLRIRVLLGDVLTVVMGKLFLHPILVMASLLIFGPVETSLAIAAVVMASSPMMSIYSIVGQKHGMQKFCAASQLLATIVSFISIGSTIWFIHISKIFGNGQTF